MQQKIKSKYSKKKKKKKKNDYGCATWNTEIQLF